MIVSEIEITDDDIRWAEQIMQLPEGAFDADRIIALKNVTSVDIQACPGSGKTTLLVAKLAILCKKWPHKTRGICVLSHTNIAREEIEKRLGNTDVAKHLLSYPHYIGTIHGFVNEFISLPWIRSKGWPVNVIDSDLTLTRRWWKLSYSVRNAQQLAQDQEKNLESNHIAKPKPIKSGRGFLGEHTQIHKELVSSITESYQSGYFTYDEMFLFANEALDNLNFLSEDLQIRFPYVFIDEAQDCSEVQNQLIHRAFSQSVVKHIRQRFGDGNQAIFNSTHAKAANTDLFPDTSNVITIRNSHRIHASIARLSDSLGLIPYGMTGNGGRKGNSPKNKIFLYNDDTISKVLPSYAELLLNEFSDDDLTENASYAVGMVHSLKNDFPIGAHVQHYLSSYNPNLNKSQPSLHNFTEFIQAGIRKFQSTNELSLGVNLIAKGIIHYLNNKTAESYPQSISPYRVLKNALSEKGGDHKALDQWLSDILLKEFNENKWNNNFFSTFANILKDPFSISPSLSKQFLQWSPLPSISNAPLGTAQSKEANIYTHEVDNRSVDIKLGSIHSVKGQTHLSTLVLDTFWNGYKGKTNLAYLTDWLKNKRKGQESEKDNSQNLPRLKCHYVAMTRATDLLCLAMPKIAVSDSLKNEFEAFGWLVEEV